MRIAGKEVDLDRLAAICRRYASWSLPCPAPWRVVKSVRTVISTFSMCSRLVPGSAGTLSVRSHSCRNR
jgi:hypothetical protein